MIEAILENFIKRLSIQRYSLHKEWKTKKLPRYRLEIETTSLNDIKQIYEELYLINCYFNRFEFEYIDRHQKAIYSVINDELTILEPGFNVICRIQIDFIRGNKILDKPLEDMWPSFLEDVS